jgi:hypothetical protein
MLKLVDMDKFETAKLLVLHEEKMKIELIMALCTNENVKKSAGLIKEWKLNIEEFPDVKERLMKNSMR